jgi:hypothetical protein
VGCSGSYRRLALVAQNAPAAGSLTQYSGRSEAPRAEIEPAGDLQAKARLSADPAAAKAEAKERAAETFKMLAGRFLTFKEGKINMVLQGEMARHLDVDAAV